MSDDAQEWRWVGEDGVEKTVTEHELIAELSSESLPNYTLIWKKGWLEWLPAMQVAQLAWALPPGKADEPASPREKDGANAPPAPPLYRYPVIKRRAGNLRADKPPPARSAVTIPRPAKAAAALEPPTIALPPRAIEPETLVAPVADLQTEPKKLAAPEPPTTEWKSEPKGFEEVEIDSIEASSPRATEDHAPLGSDSAEFDAFRPLPATFGASTYGEDDDAETRVIPSKPPPPMGALYVGPHAPPASERPPTEYDDFDGDLPRIPPPPLPPQDLAAYAGVAGDAGGQKRPLGLYAGGAAAVALVVGIIVLTTRGGDPVPGSAPSPSESAPAPAALTSAAVQVPEKPPAPRRSYEMRCTVTTNAVRVSEWAEPAVVPAFATVPGSQRVVVGFAQSEVYAVGITIDPRTLDRDQVFREFRKQRLDSVVPTVEDGSLHFRVARAGFTLGNARAVGASRPFFIGMNENGLSRLVGTRDPEPLWAFSGAEQSTVPRVASVYGFGHAVTLRRGDKSGRVAVGWLDPSGGKKTELSDVRVDEQFVGTPSIAASEDGILVAFASRGASATAWGISLATAKLGELPRVGHDFTVPPGGPGGDGMAPSVGALSGGRWLLQWTEGSSGNRVVRAQVLGRDLSPVTEPINVSPDGANAGQGAVWSKDDLGAVLFYVQNERKSHTLWGASIDCPR